MWKKAFHSLITIQPWFEIPVFYMIVIWKGILSPLSRQNGNIIPNLQALMLINSITTKVNLVQFSEYGECLIYFTLKKLSNTLNLQKHKE